jgi:hypothetical protein
VFAPFFVLLLLIGIAPAALILDGPFVHGFLAAMSAAGVAFVALTIRGDEMAKLISLVRPVAIVAIIPAVWMLIQVLPLKFIGLSHPIWTSAEAALGHSLAGSISIDPGATLLALCNYLSAVAIMLIALAVAIERRRAEWLLIALACVTTAIAVLMIIGESAGLIPAASSTRGSERSAAIDCVVLGVILSAAAGVRAFERYETRHMTAGVRIAPVMHVAWPWLAAFALCWCALLLIATRQALFAATCGVAVLAWIMGIRRFGSGRLAQTVMATIMLLSATAIIASRPTIRATDVTLALAADALPARIAITERILADLPWSGTGAGTFSALVQIYRDVDYPSGEAMSPTVAAAIAVEMGWGAMWAIVTAMVVVAGALFRGALQRGRDAFHSAAAASCVAALVLLAFCDASLFATSIVIIAATAMGIGLAQRASLTIPSRSIRAV